MAIEVAASLSSSTTINLRYRSCYSQTIYLYYLGVDIIVVHRQLLTTTFPGAQIPSVTESRNNNHNSGLNPAVPDNLLYYGLSMIAKKSSGRRPFDFKVSNTPTNFNFAINNTSDQQITTERLRFISEGECSSGSYWSMDSLTC